MYLVDERIVATGSGSVALQSSSGGSNGRPHSAVLGHREPDFRLRLTGLAAAPSQGFGGDRPELLPETVADSSHDGGDEGAAQADGPVVPVIDVLNMGLS